MKEPKVIHVAGVPSGVAKVFIDRSFDQVWLLLSHSCGSAGFHLSLEEACEVIEAMTAVIEEIAKEGRH